MRPSPLRLLAVPLHGTQRPEAARRGEQGFERFVDEQRDRLDERRQGANDALGGRGRHEARRFRIEIQADGIGPEGGGEQSVGFAAGRDSRRF